MAWRCSSASYAGTPHLLCSRPAAPPASPPLTRLPYTWPALRALSFPGDRPGLLVPPGSVQSPFTAQLSCASGLKPPRLPSAVLTVLARCVCEIISSVPLLPSDPGRHSKRAASGSAPTVSVQTAACGII